MTTQHTPGPWFANDSLQLFAETGQHLASLDSSTEGFEGGALYANARLIAAAPDLLAALKDLLGDQPFIQETGDPQAAFFHCIHCGREYGAGMDESADDCDVDCPGMIARAAIAKATGETA
jgi:hypothetical protein